MFEAKLILRALELASFKYFIEKNKNVSTLNV